MDKLNQKFDNAYNLIKKANNLIDNIHNNSSDINHLHGYKCMVSKNNKHLNNFVENNNNNIYLNSRKVWYENSELNYLRNNSFYYSVAYGIVALFLIFKLFSRSYSNKILIIIFIVVWPFLGYYAITTCIELYNFLYKRFFIKNVYVNLANH